MRSFLSQESHLLLLGGTGLFGHELLPRLHTLALQGIGPRVTLVTRCRAKALNSFPYLSRFASIIEVDFTQSASLPLSWSPTHILHMANMSASDTFRGGSQYDKYLLLLNSSLALRDVILAGGVQRVVFTSSGVAYGEEAIYKESHPSTIHHLSMESSMAFGKLTAEYILSSCVTSSTSLSIARCFSFVSPALPVDIHYALGNFVAMATRDQDIIIRSDGSDIRSYQNVSDTIDWISFLLTSNNPPPLLNVGSDSAISILELAHLVKRVLASSSDIRVLGQAPPLHHKRRSRYVPDLTLAYQFGLSNKISLESSILELAGAL